VILSPEDDQAVRMRTGKVIPSSSPSSSSFPGHSANERERQNHDDGHGHRMGSIDDNDKIRKRKASISPEEHHHKTTTTATTTTSVYSSSAT